MKPAYLAVILAASILLSVMSPIGLTLENGVQLEKGMKQDHLSADLFVHDPIMIGSDSDFETQGWPGNGSENNPYRIENLHITSTPYCVKIENTTVDFVMTDCLLDGFTRETYSSSIHLRNVSMGDFERCSMTGKRAAIAAHNIQNCSFSCISAADFYSSIYFTENSGNCIVSNSEFSLHFYHGISIHDSHDIIIKNNTISDGRQYGVWLDGSSNCHISNNTILNFRWRGICNDESDTSVIEDNIIISSPEPYAEYQQGVYVKRSSDFVFVNNSITGDADASLFLDRVSNAMVDNNTLDNGICISTTSIDQVDHAMANNVVQGKPLLYSEGLTNVILNGAEYGQIIIVDAVNVSIVGGHFDNVSSAVTISRSENCSIESTSTSGCDVYSILIQYCTNVTVRELVVTDVNGQGIFVTKSICSKVINCTIADIRSEGNVNYGIALKGDCEQSLVIGNEVHRVEFIGIGVHSSDVLIQDNIVTGTERASLYLSSCENCTVNSNNFEHGVGIWVWDWTDFNHVFNGNLVNTKELGIYRNVNDFTLDGTDFGQVFLINCSNVVVHDLVTEKVLQGVTIYNCTRTTLEHITMSSPCFDYHNQFPVLFIRESSFCSFTDITINSATHGIQTDLSHNISFHGLSITNTAYALNLHASQNLTISNSEFKYNRNGVVAQFTNHSTFTHNSILYNSYGFSLLYCHDNVIFGNDIGYNEESNAIDEGGSNTWDNDIDTGNAWSDYLGTGTYLIIGTSGSVDRYPTLLEDLPPTTTTGITTTTTTTTTEPGDIMIVIYFVIAIGSIVVIVAFVILIIRAKK